MNISNIGLDFHQNNGSLLQTKYMFTKDFLGKGKFGSVWKGIRISDGEPVAIKIIPLQKISSKKLQQSINFEIKILSKINHPNILKLYEHERTDDFLYMYFEYCGGGDLKNFVFLQGGSLDENFIKKFIKEIALGLRELYNNGIMHRDLKMDNIFLTNSLVSKIGDFGLAKEQTTLNRLSNTFCGTPLYMAPEVLKSENYTNSCDLWSIGVLLYELVYSKYPVEAFSIEELKKKVAEQNFEIKFPIKKDYPFELIDLMKKLLEVDPKKRINFTDFFKHPYIQIEKEEESVIKSQKKEFLKIEEKKIVNFLTTIISNFSREYNDDSEKKKQKDNNCNGIINENLFNFSHLKFDVNNKNLIDYIEENIKISIILQEIGILFLKYSTEENENFYIYSVSFFLHSFEILNNNNNVIRENELDSERVNNILQIIGEKNSINKRFLKKSTSKIKHFENQKKNEKMIHINVILYLFAIRLMKESGWISFVGKKYHLSEKWYIRSKIVFKYLQNFVNSFDKKILEKHIEQIEKQQYILKT